MPSGPDQRRRSRLLARLRDRLARLRVRKGSSGGSPSPEQRVGGSDRDGTERRRKRKAAAWALGFAVLAGVITEALTGIGAAPVRAVWAKVTGAEPVVVHSEVRLGQCDEWVIPGGRRGVERLPDEIFRFEEDYRAWIREHGAVQAGDTVVEMVVRGGSSDAVVLRELRVRVVERREPVRGTHVHAYCPGGEVQTTRYYVVDLDAGHPVLRPDRDPHGGGEPPVTFPYKVTHADPEVIRVTANTATCHCRWVLELVYVDGERERVKVIDDGGRPFQTTAASAVRPGRGG